MFLATCLMVIFPDICGDEFAFYYDDNNTLIFLFFNSHLITDISAENNSMCLFMKILKAVNSYFSSHLVNILR